MDTPPVVIVGAGPTGLATACGLMSAGVDVRVLEQAAGTGEHVTGPRSAAAWRRGARAPRRTRRPAAAEPAHPAGRGERRRAGSWAGWPSGGPRRLVQRPGLLVAQTEIESALRDRLAVLGGTVEWGRKVTDLRPDRWRRHRARRRRDPARRLGRGLRRGAQPGPRRRRDRVPRRPAGGTLPARRRARRARAAPRHRGGVAARRRYAGGVPAARPRPVAAHGTSSGRDGRTSDGVSTRSPALRHHSGTAAAFGALRVDVDLQDPPQTRVEPTVVGACCWPGMPRTSTARSAARA